MTFNTTDDIPMYYDFGTGTTNAVMYYTVRENRLNGDGAKLIYTGRITQLGDKQTGVVYLNDVIVNSIGNIDLDDTESEFANRGMINEYTIVATGGSVYFIDTTTSPSTHVTTADIEHWNRKYNRNVKDMPTLKDYDDLYNMADQDNYPGNDGSGKVLIPIRSRNQHVFISLYGDDTSTEDYLMRRYYTDGTHDDFYWSWDTIKNLTQVSVVGYHLVPSSLTKTIDHYDLYHGDEDTYTYITAWYTPEHFGMKSCQADYQITWVGRNGAIYTRPFYGKHTETERQERSEVVNMKDERKVYNVSNQVSITVNTGWLLSDYAIELMEDLSVSPQVLIYDINADREYDVISTTNEYTRKCYKNDKSMINYGFTFELAKKENNKFA